MATDVTCVEHVAELARLGRRLTYRKMFGEYALYLDGKVVAFACDGSLFVKPVPDTAALAARLPREAPYPGGRPHLVADALLDEPEALQALLLATAQALPQRRARRSAPDDRDVRSRRR